MAVDWGRLAVIGVSTGAPVTGTLLAKSSARIARNVRGVNQQFRMSSLLTQFTYLPHCTPDRITV